MWYSGVSWAKLDGALDYDVALIKLFRDRPLRGENNGSDETYPATPQGTLLVANINMDTCQHQKHIDIKTTTTSSDKSSNNTRIHSSINKMQLH